MLKMKKALLILIAVMLINICKIICQAKTVDNLICGLTVCRRGFQYCVRYPDIGAHDGPYCLGCNARRDSCGTERQPDSCKSFCEAYLRQKFLDECKKKNYDCSKESEDTEEIAMYAIGGAVILCIVYGIVFWYHRKGKNGRRPTNRTHTEPLNSVEYSEVAETDTESVDRTSIKVPSLSGHSLNTSETTSNASRDDNDFRPKNINPTNQSQSPKIAPG